MRPDSQRRGDQPGFGPGQSGAGEFVVAAVERGRGFIHWGAQVVRRQVGDELAALLANDVESFHPSLEKPTIGGTLEKPLKKL